MSLICKPPLHKNAMPFLSSSLLVETLMLWGDGCVGSVWDRMHFGHLKMQCSYGDLLTYPWEAFEVNT